MLLLHPARVCGTTPGVSMAWILCCVPLNCAGCDRSFPLQVGKFAFMANSRARTVDTAEGMVKFITDAKTDKVCGDPGWI